MSECKLRNQTISTLHEVGAHMNCIYTVLLSDFRLSVLYMGPGGHKNDIQTVIQCNIGMIAPISD